jgi:hypothetical protein
MRRERPTGFGKTGEGAPATPAALRLAADVGKQIAAILAAPSHVVVVQMVHFLEVISRVLELLN